MLTKKPLNRYLPDDWHRNLHDLRKGSTEARDSSFYLRQETRNLRNEIGNKNKWDYDDNTTRLEDRVYEVARVHQDLINSLEQTKSEINRQTHSKEMAERETEAHQIPIEVGLECLALRERRRDGDLVKDDLEIQLEEELKILERSRATLEKLVLDSVDCLRDLNRNRRNLEADILDKSSAVLLDSNAAGLTEFSPDVSLKPKPSEALQKAVFPLEWLEHSTMNVKNADESIDQSEQLRDKTCVAIQTTRREDEAQTRTTDFVLRRRLHQELRAQTELEWEKEKLLSEIKEQEQEILNLETCLNHSVLPLKVAQTRLENRKWRDGKDLVEDAVHSGLREEVSQLRTSRNHLRKNLESANESLQSLQRKLRKVNADLVRKSLSVNLENKTKDTRKKLKKDSRSSSLTEENLIQTGSLRAHPTYILK